MVSAVLRDDAQWTPEINTASANAVWLGFCIATRLNTEQRGKGMRGRIASGLLVGLLIAGCSHSLTPKQKAQITALDSQLDAVKTELTAAKAKDAEYTGGVVKAFVSVRVQILATTKDLLEQRIQAVESGAPMTVKVDATKPDPKRAEELAKELATQEQAAKVADAKAAGAGGLVGAMLQSAAATEQNTVALLRLQYVSAKYGLAPLALVPTGSAVPTSTVAPADATPPPTSEGENVAYTILTPTLLGKRFIDGEYEDGITLNLKFDPTGLDKPARAIKGVLILTDLFGAPQKRINWTIDHPVQPGEPYTETGDGFKYNQFESSDQWVKTTDASNMKVKFQVDSILYRDGTRRDF
jgi:hypothetical protein